MTKTAEERAAARARAARREAERSKQLGSFTPEQITSATRGLSLHAYTLAYGAGARSDSDEELDDRLSWYMGRGVKIDAHEHAFLDGNSYGDDPAAMHLQAKIEEPERF